MNHKKGVLLICLIICLFSIASVCASDVNENVLASDSQSDDLITVEDNDEIVTHYNNDNISEGNDGENDVSVTEKNDLSETSGTFTDLVTEIGAANGEFVLTRNYIYSSNDSNYKNGIVINKKITIDGNGFTINGDNNARAFKIITSNVILKNISFVNCAMVSSSYSLVNGGAIYWSGSNGALINCTFDNCYATSYSLSVDGGAIFWDASDGVLSNCSFNHCYATSSSSSASGGAVYWHSPNGFLSDNSFDDCYAVYTSSNTAFGFGGAVYWYGSKGILLNCNFTNCHNVPTTSRSYDDGGAVYWCGSEGTLFNCNFTNCHASYHGGAIYWDGINGKLFNSNFISCYASSSEDYGWGGAVYWGGDSGKLFNSSFLDCHACYNPNTVCSGAVDWRGYDGVLSGCNFTDCYVKSVSSKNYGIALFWEGINGRLLNCSFINCHIPLDQPSSTGSAIFWYEKKGIIENTYFNPNFNSIYTEDGAKDLIINKLNANFDCKNVSSKYMEEINVNVHLKDYFGNKLGNKVIIFENKDLNILISTKTNGNGIATLPTEFTKQAGNYTIYVSFNGDDNYNPIQSTFNLNIEPLDSIIIVTNYSGTVGYDTTFMVNVVCSNNININEGTVTFFDGENNIGSSNVKNGIASLNYAPNTVGKHTIRAIYNSNNYLSSNNIFNFTVSKANVDLKANVETVYFSNPTNFAITLTSNSKRINEGKLKFYIDNVFIGSHNVENGIVNFNKILNATGSFNLSLVYDETDKYFAKNSSTVFYVNQMPTTLSGETTFFDEDQYKYFVIQLKDNNNDGVSNQTIKLELIKYSGESRTFTGFSDLNGIANFDVSDLAGGMWIVRGLYYGDNNYLSSFLTDKFIVIRMNTTTTIDEIKESHKGYPIHLHANILDEFGQWVTDGLAHFYVDGKDVGYIDLSNHKVYPYKAQSNSLLCAARDDFDYPVGATVDNSQLYLEYIPTDGNHVLSVVYEGTNLYRPSNHTTTFTVQDGAVPTKLTATAITTVFNGGKNLVATLKDAWGNPIKGVKVTIKLSNGKTVTQNTDKNGQVKMSTNALAPKTYTAAITFAGDNNYAKSTTSVKVIVKKATPKLAAANRIFKRTVKVKPYTVTLKTNTNKVIKNTWVTLNVNKKLYKVRSNARGQATFKITNLNSKGIFKGVVTYGGSSCYNKVTKKVNIIVK